MVAEHVQFHANFQCDACRKNGLSPRLGGIAPPTLFRAKYLVHAPGFPPRLNVAVRERDTKHTNRSDTRPDFLSATFVAKSQPVSPGRVRWPDLPHPLPDTLEEECPQCGSRRTLVLKRDLDRAIQAARRRATAGGQVPQVDISI